MFYKIAFYIVSSYLFIALLVAFYLRRGIRRQFLLIEKIGEVESLLIGAFTTAVLWPIWLVKCFIIGFVYVTKGR